MTSDISVIPAKAGIQVPLVLNSGKPNYKSSCIMFQSALHIIARFSTYQA
jgi:hypothetical protein